LSSLGHKARSAVIWNTGFNLFRDLLQFVQMLVLVRLVNKEAYGQFSLVTSIMGFISLFSFNSFIAYTLQVKNEDETRYQEHFTAGAVLQLGVFLAANLVAVALRFFPTYAPVSPLVHVMSFTFLLEWPCELRRKMIERSFDWRKLRLLHATGLVASTVLAIVMGMSGAGIYALLVPGLLVTLPFTFDLFFQEKWRPTWAWSWQDYRAAWHFGITRMSSGLALNGRLLLESAVLTATIGFASLGVYNRAIGLSVILCQKFALQLMYAIYPVLTRIDNDGRDPARVGGLVLRLVVWLVTPIAFAFGVLAQPVIHVVYGEKWMNVVPLLPWAMAWGALAAASYAAYMLLLSRQKARHCLLIDLCLLGGTAAALATTLKHGALVYLAAMDAVQGAIMLILLCWLVSCGALSWRKITEAFAPPAIMTGIAAVGVTACFHLVGCWPTKTFWPSAVWGALFGGLYVAGLRLCFAGPMTELIRYVPGHAAIGRALKLKL
jgi:O-antigen/teichoic acid export membrane protein